VELLRGVHLPQIEQELRSLAPEGVRESKKAALPDDRQYGVL
jgi:hypothetical protein